LKLKSHIQDDSWPDKNESKINANKIGNEDAMLDEARYIINNPDEFLVEEAPVVFA